MMAEENNISLAELDGILQPIIDTCTKDSISTGILPYVLRSYWIFLYPWEYKKVGECVHWCWISVRVFFSQFSTLSEVKSMFWLRLSQNILYNVLSVRQAKDGYCSTPHHTTRAKWYRSTSYGKWPSLARRSRRSYTSFTSWTTSYTTGLYLTPYS